MKVYKKTDSFLISMFLVVLTLQALKPWVDNFTNISYQLITAFQFIIVLLSITLINRAFYIRIHSVSMFFLMYIVAIFSVGVLADIVEGDVFGIISSVYVLARAVIVVYLFQILYSFNRGLSFYKNLKFLMLSYFLVTFFLFNYSASFII